MNGKMARIGWVVDAQNDFLLPPERGGRLYVRNLFDNGEDEGAQRAIPAIERAVEWMHEHCDVMVFTGDWHSYADEEIDAVAPDPSRGTYPPHCMGLSDDAAEREGAEIIASIRPEEPIVLARAANAADARAAARRAIADRRPVFIHKSRFDVFEGNAATDDLLRALREGLGRPVEVYVAGVARDVCVKQAVEGMLAEQRRLPVTVITDATWGLGIEEEAASLGRWLAAGAALMTTAGLGMRDP
ncbi:MAG TPA: isochorismatase family protein [Longimicrobium sp.]|jgi:nicotinamidase-related amidase